MVLSAATFAQQSAQDSIIEQIVAASSKMSSLKCDFVQTKYVSLLDEAMVSKGRMSFEQPSKLCWEYTSPASFAFQLDGSAISILRDGREESMEGNQSRMIRELAKFIMSSISGSSLTDSKMFQTSIEELSSDWAAVMVPKRSDLKRMWSRLVIHFDPVHKYASRIELFEASGDKTVIEFKNIKWN